MIAILHAIERHVSALTKGPGLQAEDEFLTRYRRHVIEHHGKIEPPDFERRRRVPMVDLYVAPTIVQKIDVQDRWVENETDLWTLTEEIDRTVLLGDLGGGKTTAANAIMNYVVSSDRRVPFWVTLREFASNIPPDRSIVAYIEHKLETFYQCSYPVHLVAKLLLSGRGLIVFDGLDELLDTSHRADVTAIIERFATEYPLTRILVTSRLVGYEQARLDERQFVPYRITGFTDSQVEDYVHKWFSQEEGIEAAEIERWTNAFIDESSANQDLRANPLMLSLMCILYRGAGSLPRDRSEVYEQCASLLFRKWDARRRIHVHLRAGHLLEPTLRHIAWWLFDRSNIQSAVTQRELIQKTAEFLHKSGFESENDAKDAALQFVDFCRGRMWVFSDVGTTADGETLYSFTHRTFLEYFAAAHLAFSSDTAEQLARKLAPHVARNQWEVTGELAVQIKDHTSDRGAQRIYTILINERRRRSTSGRSAILQFLSRCLRSVDPPPATIRTLTETIFDHLLEGDMNDPDRYLPLSWLLVLQQYFVMFVTGSILVCWTMRTWRCGLLGWMTCSRWWQGGSRGLSRGCRAGLTCGGCWRRWR
jgi:predicted NACHT family NTPase